ncbi:4'-phosphopantetheinyl transferase family protein [Rhizobium rhizogenes]|uniref:4'-phosphopantetheinyl transferase family protein n=1 Tax=Rhizobium rhizogenes TaxID=359 RepID=UPI001573F5F8|nr:4'-phosphopantetheinyl transferase superfamily protein [Rhizobium rhizogenes]NTF96131.1 4'-phosphopantetheinyl transferase superfamily protein [Rhizobium rhizogenes]
MVSREVAGWMEDLTAIGSQLRSDWRAGEFHAVVSINVPHQPIDPHGLPISTEEWGRAGSFRRLMDSNRSLTGWTAVRGVVGAMLEIPPNDVQIIRAPSGKPSVHAGPGISISHAGDIAVVAFSSEMTIGVDVEQIDGGASFLPTVMHTLSPSELEYLNGHPVERAKFLLRAWARKEATAKVFGSGLSVDFRCLTVADEAGRRFQCRLPSGNVIVKGTDLEMGSGYTAALASTANIVDVTSYHVTGR